MNDEHDQNVAGYLTHELRAPLTAMKHALKILQDELGPGASERSRRILNAALLTAERVNRTVDDILDLSRLQCGRMPLSALPCDPARLAVETVESFLPWAERQEVRLHARISRDCPRVSGDAARIIQVLTNLISNALKFTPPGGEIAVLVEPGRRDDAGSVVFSVKDSGRGIAAKDIPLIFRYFMQVGPVEERAQGSGLGLPLARSLVELHGGRMWVESAEGQGSTFSFTIPVHIAASLAEEKPQDAGSLTR